MRKRVFGRRFKRDINQRKALFKGLMSSLVIYGRIKTTEAKAKAIKGQMEKVVTHARNNPTDAAHYLKRYFNEQISKKIIENIVPAFKERPGGYTRIIRVGKRVKDNAPMVLIEWVEKIQVQEKGEGKTRLPARQGEKGETKLSKKTQVKRSPRNAKTNKTNKK